MTTLTLSLETSPLADIAATTEGSYVLNDQHVLEGINHLIEFFREGPRNQAAMTAALEQFQELENALWDLYAAFDPDTATGNALELLGKLVGEPQLGRDDDEYRAAILVRVLVNSSDGQAEQLYEIALNMVDWQDVDFTVALTEYAPATIEMEWRGDVGVVSLANLYAMLKQAKAGGVKLNATLAAEDADAGEFAAIWAEADGVDLERGWAYGSESDADQGGNWAEGL